MKRVHAREVLTKADQRLAIKTDENPSQGASVPWAGRRYPLSRSIVYICVLKLLCAGECMQTDTSELTKGGAGVM